MLISRPSCVLAISLHRYQFYLFEVDTMVFFVCFCRAMWSSLILACVQGLRRLTGQNSTETSTTACPAILVSQPVFYFHATYYGITFYSYLWCFWVISLILELSAWVLFQLLRDQFPSAVSDFALNMMLFTQSLPPLIGGLDNSSL